VDGIIKGTSLPATRLEVSVSSIKTSVDEAGAVPPAPMAAEFFTVSLNFSINSGPKYPWSDQMSSRSSRRR
jgi:hypothetical protein